MLKKQSGEEEALGRESRPDKYLTEDSYPEYIQLENEGSKKQMTYLKNGPQTWTESSWKKKKRRGRRKTAEQYLKKCSLSPVVE